MGDNLENNPIQELEAQLEDLQITQGPSQFIAINYVFCCTLVTFCLNLLGLVPSVTSTTSTSTTGIPGNCF